MGCNCFSTLTINISGIITIIIERSHSASAVSGRNHKRGQGSILALLNTETGFESGSLSQEWKSERQQEVCKKVLTSTVFPVSCSISHTVKACPSDLTDLHSHNVWVSVCVCVAMNRWLKRVQMCQSLQRTCVSMICLSLDILGMFLLVYVYLGLCVCTCRQVWVIQLGCMYAGLPTGIRLCACVCQRQNHFSLHDWMLWASKNAYDFTGVPAI